MAKNGSISNALGLFTFAIEEYGKALLLKEQNRKEGNNILVPSWIFGGKQRRRSKSHQEKFTKALKDIPYECATINLWEEKVLIGSPHTRIIELKELGTRATISANTTGTFSLPTDPDFEERLKVLYVDWDNDKKKWIIPTRPVRNSFLKSMNNFMEFLEDPIEFKNNRN